MHRLYWGLATILALAGCGKSQSHDEADCDQEKASIDADVMAVGACSADADCAGVGVHPHWGCYLYYNKAKDPQPVLDRIDDYSESECWDGRTTLRLLDCASPLPPSCVSGQCSLVPFAPKLKLRGR
jgi:hypothetical protein